MKYIFTTFFSVFYAAWAIDENRTYLVINKFSEPISGIDESLTQNFEQVSFNFQTHVPDIFQDIKIELNPAGRYIEKIKDLGENHNVDYVVYNDIKYEGDKLVIEGLFFNTLSGGLINRRMINVTNYEDRIFNELNLWVGKILTEIQNEWEQKRKSVLFLDPEKIKYDKTPFGAALRSFVVPGWGQMYSGNILSAGVWGGIEFFLVSAFIFSYSNYDKSAKSFLNNSDLYNKTDDEKKVSFYRNAAELDWSNHVLYSKMAIALAGTSLIGWISNTIHAWVFGPRPYTNIYQKGRATSVSPTR